MLRPTVDEYQRRLRESQLRGERPRALTGEESVQLICEVGRTTPVTIILDALDECDSRQRILLISALHEISSSCRDAVKIFVSSREGQEIAAHFNHGKSLNITAESNREDLERYVDRQVGQFLNRWSFTHNETVETLLPLWNEITHSLVSGAQGM